jgi:glycosyltransferase involved in cell wall biosynthesis
VISVIVPVRNREFQIERALVSIRRQTFEDWEAIVIDDASDDGTAATIRETFKNEQRFKLIRLPERVGAQAARNAGIRAAVGSWIAFLDSDDEWMPTSLETRLHEATSRGIEVVHSECLVLRDEGDAVPFEVPPLAGNAYAQLLERPGPMFQGLLVSSKAISTIGALDERIRAYQEWDTSIRLAKHFSFGFIAEPTFVYRQGSPDAISRDPVTGARGYGQVVRKHMAEMLRVCGTRTLQAHMGIIATLYERGGAHYRSRAFYVGQRAIGIPARLRSRKR